MYVWMCARPVDPKWMMVIFRFRLQMVQNGTLRWWWVWWRWLHADVFVHKLLSKLNKTCVQQWIQIYEHALYLFCLLLKSYIDTHTWKEESKHSLKISKSNNCVEFAWESNENNERIWEKMFVLLWEWCIQYVPYVCEQLAIHICTYICICMYVCTHMSVCLFACYLFTRWIHCWGTHRQKSKRETKREVKGKESCSCCRREAEEKSRERRQQVSAWESRVKYLVLVKRRRKRTRRTRLQFTRAQVTVHAQRAIVCATRAAPAVLGITVDGLTTNARKWAKRNVQRTERTVY